MVTEQGIRGFRRMDAHEINLMGVFGNELHARERFIDAVGKGAPAYTVTFPGSDSPLACFGSHWIDNGVIELWALVDREVENFAHYYARRTKLLLEFHFDQTKAHRAQIFIRADQPWCHRWAHYLGLTLEGRLKKYGADGSDYFLFAKVRE